MSSYFDKFDRDIRELGEQDITDAQFLTELTAYEKALMEQVSALTGDIEFPEEHRERIQGIIALHYVGIPTQSQRVLDVAVLMRVSNLSQHLHDAFHDVARARIETRFGRLSDSPQGDLMRRDEHDKETRS